MLRCMDGALLLTFANEIRDRLAPGDVGSIWALYVDAQQRPLLGMPVGSGTAGLDADNLRTVAYLLGNVGAHAVVAAVPRPDGQPTAADREFWRRLRVLMVCEPTELIDLLVVGDESFWSAQQEDDKRGAVA